MLRIPFAAALAAALAAPVPAAAELLVAPTRVVLTTETRAAELVLVNKGAETAAFRIAIENRRMMADGSLDDASAAQDGELFADDKLRYSPRQLVLEPGARQVVRIMASAPVGLAPGEYRSHLRLMFAPVSAGAATVPGEGLADNSLAIELVAIRSITIPVILRVGALEASVTMDSARVADTAPDQLVVRGVAIYVPNTARDVIIPLPPEVRGALAGKRVRIDYTSTDAADPANAGKRLASLVAGL